MNTVTDFSLVKAKQQAAWAAGDYAVVGTTLQIVGETLCEALDLRAGQRVLDVAAGNGNATLAAARRWCDVCPPTTSPRCSSGPARAPAPRVLAVQFEQADAEDLQYEDGAFDVVISTFGVMFTPNQERAAAELARVCKPGGKIGLANWTPTSLVGEMFKLIGRYLPPAAGMKSPALWGTEERLRELFGSRIAAPCRRRGATSCSATALPGTGSTPSAPTTGRCTRRSRRSTPASRSRSPRTCSGSPSASTAPPTARWWRRASTSRP
jgi:SAM-dependent methyltransferase